MLPVAHELERTAVDNQVLAEDLASLGYPGFAYLRPRRWKKNPAEVLLTALLQENLEARVVEAVTWLLLRYWDMNADWLVEQAKRLDLQNRLGFVVTLAREVAERVDGNDAPRSAKLRELQQALEASKLARTDTLCQVLTPHEREWVLRNRPPEAEQWNLLTSWSPAMLRYAIP